MSIIGTISHGTLRPQDLLVSFAEAYKQHREPKFFDKTLFVCAKALALYLENSSNPSPMEYDVAQDFLDDLIVQLEMIAAENDCYFGTTEGDGSDFGFWPNDGGESDDPFEYSPDEIGEIVEAHDKLHQEFQTDGKVADREADQVTDGKTIRSWKEIHSNLTNLAEDLRIEQILKDGGIVWKDIK